MDESFESSETSESAEDAAAADDSIIGWNEIVGLGDTKSILGSAVAIPLRQPQCFTDHGITQILLVGPSGTGKTLAAQSVATHFGVPLFAAHAHDLMLQERLFHNAPLTQLLNSARASDGDVAVVVVDDVDLLSGNVLSQLPDPDHLRIEGRGKNVVLIGTTTSPSIMHDPVQDFFQYGNTLHTCLPDTAARQSLFASHLRSKPNHLSVQDINELTVQTNGTTGRDIRDLVEAAAHWGPIRRARLALQFVPDTNGHFQPCCPDNYPNCKECMPFMNNAVACPHCGAHPRLLVNISTETLNLQATRWDFDRILPKELYSAAMTWMCQKRQPTFTPLFFPIPDATKCASKIRRILERDQVSRRPDLSDDEWEQLGLRTAGSSAAELHQLIQRAVNNAKSRTPSDTDRIFQMDDGHGHCNACRARNNDGPCRFCGAAVGAITYTDFEKALVPATIRNQRASVKLTGPMMQFVCALKID